MKNTTPQEETSQKKTLLTSFQICVKHAELAFDTSLDPSMVQKNIRVDRTITGLYSMPRTLSGLRLVQTLIELRREEAKTTLSLSSIPLTTIYGEEDLSRLDSFTLKEQVISPIITLTKSMLQQAGLKISASCLAGLASDVTTSMQYQINLPTDHPFTLEWEQSFPRPGITATKFVNLPESKNRTI